MLNSISIAEYPRNFYIKENNQHKCNKQNFTFTGDTSILAKRNKALSHSVSTGDKLKAFAGSVIGTTLALSLMMKKQKVKNPFKLKYDVQDMIVSSSFAIGGGVAVGMIGETKETNNNKLKEGIFQTLNAAIPPWVVAGGIKLCEGSHHFNNIPGKIMALVAGLLVGMYGAASVSNIICDPHDKAPDRKLNLKDGIANIDDALGVLVLAKFPFASMMHLESFLPLIYTYCGYRAGKSN